MTRNEAIEAILDSKASWEDLVLELMDRLDTAALREIAGDDSDVEGD